MNVSIHTNIPCNPGPQLLRRCDITWSFIVGQYFLFSFFYMYQYWGEIYTSIYNINNYIDDNQTKMNKKHTYAPILKYTKSRGKIRLIRLGL